MMNNTVTPKFAPVFDNWVKMNILKSYRIIGDHLNGMADYQLLFSDNSTMTIENGHEGYFTLIPATPAQNQESATKNNLESAPVVARDEQVKKPSQNRKSRTIPIRNSTKGEKL